MQITISPVAGHPGCAETAVTVSGDIITIDGVAYDFGPLGNGDIATVEAGPGEVIPITGPVTRHGGEIHLTVEMAYDSATAAPVQPSQPVTVQATAGPIPDPIIRREVSE